MTSPNDFSLRESERLSQNRWAWEIYWLSRKIPTSFYPCLEYILHSSLPLYGLGSLC